jgi:N-terminal domain of NWD NACHT-NTPase
LNPGKQEAARVKALEDLAHILSLCKMREQLYQRLYEEHKSHDEKSEVREKKPTSSSHLPYREALRDLYVAILKFQATCFCFLSKRTGTRIAQDAVIWKDWNNLFGEIKDKETKFCEMSQQWKDDRYEDECEATQERHVENLARLGAIEEEVSRVREAIEQNGMDEQRESLLCWLSSGDPSTKHKIARDNHQSLSGDWLVLRNEEFQRWKKTESSLFLAERQR